MISREDFIFTIGYDGETAIVDGREKRRYGRLGTRELADAGRFKPALCSGLYEDDAGALAYVLEQYNRRTETRVDSIQHLKRVFGVTDVPEAINKTLIC